MLLLYNSATQWQMLVTLLKCSSLYISSIRIGMFSKINNDVLQWFVAFQIRSLEHFI